LEKICIFNSDIKKSFTFVPEFDILITKEFLWLPNKQTITRSRI